MAYAPLGSPSYSAHPREDKERPRTRAKTLRLVRAPVYEDSDTESVDLDLPSDPVSPSTVSSSAKPRARSKSSTKASTHRKSVAKEVTPVLEAPSPESEEVDELVDEGVVEPEERVASPPEVSPSPPPRRLRRLVRRASTTEVPETPAPEDPEVASPEALPEAALLAAAPEAQSRGGSASEAEGEMEGRQEDEDVVMGNMEMAGEDLSADEALALDLQREELERAGLQDDEPRASGSGAPLVDYDDTRSPTPVSGELPSAGFVFDPRRASTARSRVSSQASIVAGLESLRGVGIGGLPLEPDFRAVEEAIQGQGAPGAAAEAAARLEALLARYHAASEGQSGSGKGKGRAH